MPIDRGVIDQQLQALRESSQWWDQREFRALPAVLDAHERILALSRGKLGRPRWLHRSWLIVVTDRRLLCVRSSGGTSWRQLEVSAEQITRVAFRIGLFRGRVVVAAGAQTFRMLVPRADGYKLINALSNLGSLSHEAFSGFAPTRMVRRVMDHVLALPAVALDPDAPSRPPPPPDTSLVDRRVQSLEDEMEQLRQQVDFLEQLLRQRHLSAAADERLHPAESE